MDDRGGRLTRCFLALSISNPDLAHPRDLSLRMKEGIDGSMVKWVQPENLHLTLYFFGSLNRGRLIQARRAVEAMNGSWEPIPVSWGDLGCFPSKTKVQTIWLGLNDLEGRLAKTVSEAHERLRSFEFPGPDKPFRAHLTLGRVRRGAKFDWARLEEIEGGLTPAVGPFMIRSMRLFQSILRPQGPLYTTLVEAPSRGSEPANEGE